VSLPSWYKRGACVGDDLEAFFPLSPAIVTPEAKAACARCGVRQECLEFALKSREAGHWGGMSETQRADERRRRSRRGAAAAAREQVA
jgi:WhiB family transcriptional regulator, redox-sensing transcriptional regulator